MELLGAFDPTPLMDGCISPTSHMYEEVPFFLFVPSETCGNVDDQVVAAAVAAKVRLCSASAT